MLKESFKKNLYNIQQKHEVHAESDKNHFVF